MKVAITGANGHIGANLIRKLLKRGDVVSVLYHHNNTAFKDLEIKTVKGDLGDPASLVKLFEGTEIVYHLAAQISIGNFTLEQLIKINFEGTENVINACNKAGVKRMVHFSSIHAYKHEPLDVPLNENNPLNLESKLGYERTKALAEELVLRKAQEGKLEIVVVNPTAVIGPYDFGPSYLGQLFIRLYKGRIPALIPGGYDWVDARDVAEGAIAAALHGEKGEKYILSGNWLSLKALTELSGKACNKDLRKPVIPYFLGRAGLPFIQGWAKLKKEHPLYTRESLQILQSGNRNIQCNKAIETLGYNPRPLELTLKDTFDWFKQNGYI
jgi:dihydroflavonol-4-reductase